MAKATPINIAEHHLLKAMISRQLTGDARNPLTTEILASLPVDTNYVWKLLGNGRGTRLNVRPSTYDKLVKELDGFGFRNYKDFAEKYAAEEQVMHYSKKRFEKLEQYGDISALRLWAQERANQLFGQLVPITDQQQLEHDLAALKALYQQYQLTRGCQLANEAIQRFPLHSGIVRWWALFHNRTMNWKGVRKELLPRLENADQELRTVCQLAIFESHLNKFTREKSQAAFQKLLKAKHQHLDQIPGKEDNGHYHYFLARFIEEEWWMSPAVKRESAMPQLIQAINSIDRSIDLYQLAGSGYQAIEHQPWWLHCHRCILLKLSGHEKFTAYRDDYGRMILEILFSPANLLKKSMQVYAVTFYLLSDQQAELALFLGDLDTRVRLAHNGSATAGEDISEVDNFTYHHTDLLFVDEPEKRQQYYHILNNWFKQKIT